jgi:hypothetical protein
MKAPAWLLTMNGGCRVAVGEGELVHIISGEVERVFVPGKSERITEFIVWENRQLPLFDVVGALRSDNSASGSMATAVNDRGAIIAIAAYKHSNAQQVEFGALPVYALPERIEVSDDSGCELPPESAGWRGLAHSCFKHQQHGAVPILNLGRVFAPALNSGYPCERSDQS